MRDVVDFSEGRRGAVLSSKGKTRITIHIDSDVLEAFRGQAAASGKGYQTLMNEALRASLTTSAAPVTEDVLRRVLREEIHPARDLVARARQRAALSESDALQLAAKETGGQRPDDLNDRMI